MITSHNSLQAPVDVIRNKTQLTVISDALRDKAFMEGVEGFFPDDLPGRFRDSAFLTIPHALSSRPDGLTYFEGDWRRDAQFAPRFEDLRFIGLAGHRVEQSGMEEIGIRPCLTYLKKRRAAKQLIALCDRHVTQEFIDLFRHP